MQVQNILANVYSHFATFALNYLFVREKISGRVGNKCFLVPHVGALFLGNEHNGP